MPPFRASNARCELSCDMRSYVTSNENVPRHSFALARFFVGMVRRRGVVSKRTQAAPRFGGRGGIPPAPGVSLISECTNPHVMDYCGRLSVRRDRPSPSFSSSLPPDTRHAAVPGKKTEAACGQAARLCVPRASGIMRAAYGNVSRVHRKRGLRRGSPCMVSPMRPHP